MRSPLVRLLSDGPLDIVGDVHGEIAALRNLMQHLGYDEAGVHPAGRRLVFVGDLTDRGPDSVAVVGLVHQLVETGRAQCILGNHDLNILLDHRKLGNSWFYGEPSWNDEEPVPHAPADETTRQAVIAFFRTLPIALERDDLRIVHACWNNDMIEIARSSTDAVSLYREHHERIEDSFPGVDLDEVDRQLQHQNQNPVKRLTSGPEKRVDTPFTASGKTRQEKRVPWWNDYHDTFCVFGHYSIRAGEPRGNAASFCVDYGVGKRWTERKEGKTGGFQWKLAALRWPEQTIVFDEGAQERPL